MTAFPAITPSSRAFTPGRYANTPFEALSGGQTRVRHSDAYAAARLQLTFAAISEADMLAIWNHFINRTGTFQSFTLPAEVFSQDDAIDYTAQSAVWIYASSGVVEDLPCGGHNVQLELRTVPSANVVLIGIAIGVSIKLVAGAAAAANGAQLTVGVSIEIGGIWVLGLAKTVTASLSTAGTATGGIGISGEGVIAEIRASLNPGFAFAGLSRVFNVATSLAAGTGFSSTDLDFNSVELLVHGWDGVVDSSTRSRALTAGSALTTTTEARFGGEAILFTQVDDSWLDIPEVSITGDCTMEAWIYLNSLPPDASQTSTRQRLLTGNNSGSTNGLAFGTGASGIFVTLNYTQGGGADLSSSQGFITVGKWHHIRATHAAGVNRIFIDGVVRATSSFSSSTFSLKISSAGYLSKTGNLTGKLDGALQGLRITAMARSTAGFTLPTQSWPDTTNRLQGGTYGVAQSVAATLATNELIRSAITYSQSSTWSGATAASNAIMTDGSFINTGTATSLGNPAWVRMDLGAIYRVAEVVIGTATSNIPGGWNKSYTENRNIQFSLDNTTWTTAFSTGTFASNGIYTFSASFTARYVRIATTSNDYVAISEFYATAAGTATGAADTSGIAETVTATLAEGAASSP
jgi:hypothetical protein